MSYFYNYSMMRDDLSKIQKQIDADPFKCDEIVAIARGGLVPGVILSHKYDLPITCVNFSLRDRKVRGDDYLQLDTLARKVERGMKMMLIDDILDSGKTMAALQLALKTDRTNSRVVSLLYNIRQDITPSYYGRAIDRNVMKDWVTFWWEYHE